MGLNLTAKVCRACEGGMPPLTLEEISKYIPEVKDWELVGDPADGGAGKVITKTFTLKDFKGALAAIEQIGEIAEAEGHHPDLNLHGWNKLTVTLTTHALGGLSENDFIVAAKIDQLNLA